MVLGAAPVDMIGMLDEVVDELDVSVLSPFVVEDVELEELGELVELLDELDPPVQAVPEPSKLQKSARFEEINQRGSQETKSSNSDEGLSYVYVG
jgi:hypothetical protein